MHESNSNTSISHKRHSNHVHESHSISSRPTCRLVEGSIVEFTRTSRNKRKTSVAVSNLSKVILSLCWNQTLMTFSGFVAFIVNCLVWLLRLESSMRRIGKPSETRNLFNGISNRQCFWQGFDTATTDSCR